MQHAYTTQHHKNIKHNRKKKRNLNSCRVVLNVEPQKYITVTPQLFFFYFFFINTINIDWVKCEYILIQQNKNILFFFTPIWLYFNVKYGATFVLLFINLKFTILLINLSKEFPFEIWSNWSHFQNHQPRKKIHQREMKDDFSLQVSNKSKI